MNPLIQFEKICLVCVAVLACYGLSPALNANTIRVTNRVTNTNDSGTGSLRHALAAAHNGDTIDATGVSGRILLTSGALQTNSFFNNNVRIIGPGAGNLAVDGNATSPGLKISPPTSPSPVSPSPTATAVASLTKQDSHLETAP